MNVKAIEVNPYLKKQPVSSILRVFWLVINHKSLKSFIPFTHSFFLNIGTLSSHLLIFIKLSIQPFDALNLVSASIPLAICKASCRSSPETVWLKHYRLYTASFTSTKSVVRHLSLSLESTIGLIYSAQRYGKGSSYETNTYIQSIRPHLPICVFYIQFGRSRQLIFY